MADTQEVKRWDLTIKPVSGWFDIHVSELWKYRDLIILFVRRDFVSAYKQAILGPVWFLIPPLATTLVFTVIFGRVAKISTDGLPQIIFYMSGVVAWSYFSSCLIKTSDTFRSHAHIFGKVYFPRLTVPISIVISNLLTFGIQFLLFLGFVFYFYYTGASIRPQLVIALFPLLILQMAVLGLGFGIIISSLTTKYRDLSYMVGFGVQLWMYATPIVYPTSLLSKKWQAVMAFNPMAPIIETFRYAFLGAGTVHIWQVCLSLMITLLIFLVGILLFSRIEKSFMDTV